MVRSLARRALRAADGFALTLMRAASIVTLLAPVAAPAALAAEQAGEPEYSFRTEGHVRLRSGPIEVSWESIPFNRTYAELTREQQALFKTLYVGMPEADEPPPRMAWLAARCARPDRA